MIRVLIVDDHDLVRTGMRHLLSCNPDFKVVGEADSGEMALELLPSVRPDVVLMDLNMPGMGGIEATRRIADQYPQVRVAALTALTDCSMTVSLHQAGALGYISKGSVPEELFDGIRAVRQGRPFISADMARKLSMERIQGRSDSPFAQITGREMDVLLLVLAGNRPQRIAELLQLSPKTVSTYRSRIYEKLAVDSDVALALLCFRQGLMPDEQG